MNLAIMGAAGRMGRTLTRLVHEAAGCSVAGGLEQPGSASIGADMGTLAGIGELGVRVGDDPLKIFTEVDGIIDFTTPDATLQFAALSAQARIVHVIGTTGCSVDDDARIAAAARHARVIKAGNMSLGVNLLVALVKKVAASLDQDFDIEVLEMHHKHKVDAPSGTALMLGLAAASGRDADLGAVEVRSRDGLTGARKRGDIGFATLRGGSVVGEHQVLFAGEGETISLGHRAESRDVFGYGAVKAAVWGMDQKPGFYSMSDVLGLSEL